MSMLNKYHAPGGIIEFVETIVECAAREVEEEVGVLPEFESLFDIREWTAERDDLQMQFVGLFYICKLPSCEFTLKERGIRSILG